MDRITYTFPADSPVPQLRGVTVSGGVFCVASGKWQNPIDAVRFATEVDGRPVMAMIAGKPELEKALADHLAAAAAKTDVLASIGWPQYQAIQSRAVNARHDYHAASAHGYPIREARSMHAADDALDAAQAEFPLAAAYAKAESYSMAANDEKASAGRRAMDAIESGADPLVAVEKMNDEWSASAARSVANS